MPKKAKQELVPEETLVGEVVEPRKENIHEFARRIDIEAKEKFWNEFCILFIKKDTTLFDALTRNILSWV